MEYHTCQLRFSYPKVEGGKSSNKIFERHILYFAGGLKLEIKCALFVKKTST